jgi:hypothetical protein
MGKTSKKILVADVARAAKKLQEEKDGERVISDFSTPALREFALSFGDQYKEQQSRNASSKEDKRDQGLWIAVKEIRETSPEMDAAAVWNNLDGRRVGTRWALDLEDDHVVQIDNESDKTIKTKEIKFITFKRHYYYEVLKK